MLRLRRDGLVDAHSYHGALCKSSSFVLSWKKICQVKAP